MKQIKDPIYGYVNIEDFYIDLIDTPEYQRLRRIVQTSYQALYPSALHNRFVHSIGVYHLGKKAFSCFMHNVIKSEGNNSQLLWNKWEITFLAACLLHDIGHSPFSHTGEDFYKKGDFREEIHKLLPDSSQLYHDLTTGTGKPHEAMSAIVGLHLIRRLEKQNDIDEELFVRCIIGNTYENTDKLIENTIIGMLNGSLIDVDKLDYLIRDGFVTGFNTMALDVDRLFAGYTIVNYIDSSSAIRKVAAYKRGALSVIENVTFANDLERHWIQSHPTILYDTKLLQLAIISYNNYMINQYSDIIKENTIFTQEALSYNGYKEKGVPLALLCDDDIIYYLKNCLDNSAFTLKISKQYFDRSTRLKPLWKSETEFLHLTRELVGLGIRRSFTATLKAIKENVFFINQDEMDEAIAQKDAMEQAMLTDNEELRTLAKLSLQNQEKIIQIFDMFNQLHEDEELNFDFAIIFVDQHYESNYRKLENSDIYIEFTPDRVIPLRTALSITAIPATEEEKNGYYYIYTSKENIAKMKSKHADPAQVILAYIAKHW